MRQRGGALAVAFLAAVLVSARPAASQCVDAAEPNDDCAGTFRLTCANPPGPPLTPTCIEPAGELDYFVFDGLAGDLLTATVRAEALGSLLDAMLALLDTDCLTQLAFNDDFAFNDPRVRYILPADGAYFLIAEGFGGTSTGDYELTLTCGPCDVSEPNDTPAAAALIDCANPPPDPLCIDTAADVDLFKLSLIAGTRLTVSVHAWLYGWPLDPFLRVLDTDGTTLLSQDDNTDGLDPRILFTAPADGTYYVEGSGVSGTTGLYEIEVSCANPVCIDVAEPNGTTAQAYAVTCSDPPAPAVSPTCIDPVLDFDVFSLNASEGQRLTARVHARDIGSPLDAVLALFAADGVTELARVNDTYGRDPEISGFVYATGARYLSVEGWLGSTGAYNLEITCAACDLSEPNDTSAQAPVTACSWPAGPPARSCIFPALDQDVYAVDATAGMVASARVYAQARSSPLDARLALLASDGATVLAEADDTVGLDPEILFPVPADGRYYWKVEGVSGTSGLYDIEVSCRAGICADAAEPNNDHVSAFSLACSDPPAAPPDPTCIDPPADVDFFSFQASPGDYVAAAVLAQRMASSLDAVLVLYAADGITEILRSDDTVGLDPELGTTVRQAGTYYLAVKSYNGNSQGLHSIVLGCTRDQDLTEPNDDPASAHPAACSSPGAFVPEPTAIDPASPADQDFFSLQGQAGKRLIARVDAEAAGSPLNARFALIDTDGTTVLLEALDTTGLDPALQYDWTRTGTYFLRVASENGTSGFYFLHVECQGPPCGDATEPNDTAAEAYAIECEDPPAAPPEPLCIGNPADVDMFRFDALASDLMVARVVAWNLGTGLDPVLRLLDGKMTLLAESHDVLGRDPYLVYAITAPGTFFLEVTGELGTSGAYHLDLRCKQSGLVLRRGGPADPADCAPALRGSLLPPPAVDVVTLPYIDAGYRAAGRPPDDNACILYYQVDGNPRIALLPEPGNPTTDIRIEAF